MPHYYPVIIPSGRSLAGDSLGFHAYSLRIDNLTNQWLLEETTLAWIPPYSLGTCLRLYGTGVAILLNQAPLGQPQLAPIAGEQAVGVYSDQLRTEVGGQAVRQFTLVQTVSDLSQGPQPALPPVGIDRLYADSSGNIHHLHSDGTDRTLFDASTVYVAGGVLQGPLQNPQHSTGPHDFPALIRTMALGNYTPASGAGLELYYSGGSGQIQSYNRSGTPALTPLQIQASTLTLNPSGACQIYRPNFQTAIVTNSNTFDAVVNSDWFRAATAGYGIYNNANGQGVGLGASGPYDYATSRTLAKLPIAGTDISNGAISWAQMIAPNGTQSLSWIGGTQSAPAGSTTSSSYVFCPAPFNGISYDVRRGSGALILWDGVAYLNISTAGQTISFGVTNDGALQVGVFAQIVPQAGNFLIPFCGYFQESGWGAGSHSFGLQWATNGGTLSWRQDIYSWVRVWEQRA